jgi:uncharacterized protein with FMN-binding domain
MKSKIKKIQIVRILVQIAFLFLLPGLFTLTFSGIKSIYLSIIKGNFNLAQSYPNVLELFTIIPLTIILGRFFCGWMCAFGTFNDIIYKISKHIFKVDFKVNSNVDAVIKYVKYLILLMLIFFVWTKGSTLFVTSNPWDAFGQITSFPQVISKYTVGFILLVLIGIGAAFIERFFCRYLCPLGAIFSITSRISIFKISKPNDKCGKCRICTNNCSMGIQLYKAQEQRGGECISCLRCVEVCPRRNTHANILNENVNPALASSVAIATFGAIYALNNIGGATVTKYMPTTASVSSTVAGSQQGKYKDGTYKGTADGYESTIAVTVTVKGGKITDVTVDSINDTPGYYEKAKNGIPGEIIQAQSTSVDTVSGATHSSDGIINAVKDALKNATVSSSTNKITATSNSNSSSSGAQTGTTTPKANSTTKVNNTTAAVASSTTASQGKYKNGTYTGTADGFRPGLQVAVTVKGGKISDIQIQQINDTPRFYHRAVGVVPNEIIQAQTPDVDTVSGATYSSTGIINAVKNALSKA